MKKNLLIFLFVMLFRSITSDAQSGFAVVELFTSEGCSSCPPAEKVFNDIINDAEKNHKSVYCLEYHVDYWNRGGWKDLFSKNQFTLRQNMYSATLQQRELYTPQMIVNGETEFIGSHKDEATVAIEKSLKDPPKLSLTIDVDSTTIDSIYIHYSSSETNKNFSLHFAVVESGLVSKIGKGENSGKTLTHNHVVRIFYSTSLNEKSDEVKIPLNKLKLNANCSLIVFAQHKQTMKVLGVAEKKFPGF